MKAAEPERVVLFISILSGDEELTSRVEGLLEERFGAVSTICGPVPFGHSDYYASEMGPGLTRSLVAFEDLIDPGELSSIKVFTNGLEASFLQGTKRSVNIDPGYLALEKVVLASCKNFSHRIYIGSGIYADLTLIRKGGAYESLAWTYAEYAKSPIIDFLEMLRDGLRGSRASRKKGV